MGKNNQESNQVLFKNSIVKLTALLSDEVKEIMRDHKPESITRARRAFIEPTEGQREEEQNYRAEYLNNQ